MAGPKLTKEKRTEMRKDLADHIASRTKLSEVVNSISSKYGIGTNAVRWHYSKVASGDSTRRGRPQRSTFTALERRRARTVIPAAHRDVGWPSGIASLVKALGKLSRAQLKTAVTLGTWLERIEKLEYERQSHIGAIQELERRIAKLSIGNGAVTASPKPGRKPGRKKGWKLSAATRRKMREAAKRRWGGGAKSEVSAPAVKRTRKPFSAETRAKMAAAQQARWAKVKGTSVPKAEAKA